MFEREPPEPPRPNIIEKWDYTVTSYAVAAFLFAGAVWLVWDWSWLAKLPLLAYLAVGAVVSPAAGRRRRC